MRFLVIVALFFHRNEQRGMTGQGDKLPVSEEYLWEQRQENY